MVIQAQLTLSDGKTPGAWRKGASIILACIAAGCRIVPNPLNKIPDEWSRYVVDQHEHRTSVALDQHNDVVKRKRGRPKKTA